MFNLFGNRKEQEEQVKSAGRLPPGQSLTQKFPVLHYGPVPPFNPATWDFRVFGLVEEEKRWTWDEFNRLPRRQMKLDIHCVTRWSKFDTVWEGVHLKDLIDQGFIRLKPEANVRDAALRIRLHRQRSAGSGAERCVPDGHALRRPAARSRSRLSAARRGRRDSRTALGRRSLFLEGRQVAARTGVHGSRSARLLGTGRLFHDGQCLERRTVWLVTPNLPESHRTSGRFF